MRPRRWLSRKSRRLEHNQCRSPSYFYPPFPLRIPPPDQRQLKRGCSGGTLLTHPTLRKERKGWAPSRLFSGYTLPPKGGPPAQSGEEMRANAVVRVVMTCLIIVASLPAGETARPVRLLVGRGPFGVNTAIPIEVKNQLPVSITFCADFGASVHTAAGVRPAPNPFELERWTGSRWNTQLVGSDVGNSFVAMGVDARQSKQFLLEVNAPGRYRVRLTYIKGEGTEHCPIRSAEAVTIDSPPFSAAARPN
jgi:hypothetical protein